MTQGAPLTPQVPKLQDFVAATGFNFRDDVDRVTIGRLDARRAIFVIQARFDQFKVERYLADHVTRLDTYMGRTIYEDRDHDFGVAFIDGLVIAGYTDAVKKAVEQRRCLRAASRCVRTLWLRFGVSRLEARYGLPANFTSRSCLWLSFRHKRQVRDRFSKC